MIPYVGDLRCCTRGGDGMFDGESMVAPVDRPAFTLYRVLGQFIIDLGMKN